MVRAFRRLSWVAALGALLVALAIGCDRTQRTPQDTSQEEGATMVKLILQSEAFSQNQTVPRKHTDDGDDISPPLTWSDLPEGTKELALIMDDPDAPRPEPWVHWVLYGIPADARSLPEGVPTSARVSSPAGALQGKNSFGNLGYGGPAPPRGHGVHHYHFKLYALDLELNLEPGATKEALLKAMQGHILAQGELVGTYQR